MEPVIVYITEDEWNGEYQVFTDRNEAIVHIIDMYKDTIIDVVRDSILDDLRLMQDGTIPENMAELVAGGFGTIKEDLTNLFEHGYIEETATIHEAELRA